MIKYALPCGIPVEERSKPPDPRYILTCFICGAEADCVEHKELITRMCTRFQCDPSGLTYCCMECKAMADATLTNPLNFGRA